MGNKSSHAATDDELSRQERKYKKNRKGASKGKRPRSRANTGDNASNLGVGSVASLNRNFEEDVQVSCLSKSKSKEHLAASGKTNSKQKKKEKKNKKKTNKKSKKSDDKSKIDNMSEVDGTYNGLDLMLMVAYIVCCIFNI